NTVYVSIPKNVAADCSDLGLPTLPSLWSYGCVASSTLRDPDGTGWIPVNFNLVSYGSPIEKLPVDPINTTSSQQYYTYVPGGSWELTTEFESQKYLPKAINDGDSYPGVYSLRTSSAPLTPGTRDYGLVGYWKFDEGSGTLYDSSGYGNNGTQSGGVTYGVAGKVGNALSFDGTDDLIDLGNINYSSYGAISFSAWIKTPVSAVATHHIAFGNTANNCATGFALSYYQPNVGYYAYHGSVMPFLGITFDQWTFIVWTIIRGTNSKIYVNGNYLIGSTPTSYSFNTGNNTYVGRGAVAGQNLNAIIDDFRVYNRALSAAEIAAIYNATK
ncbi:MAG: LamG domain-containing protein, partial [Candidatus Wolfebacteria bacterium]|nr:LamG domain-containing protein [Candidatus Wolfebacteria bacterium]